MWLLYFFFLVFIFSLSSQVTRNFSESVEVGVGLLVELELPLQISQWFSPIEFT